MADDGHSGGAGDDGQDICTFFSSFLNQRLQMERLISWLRDSQTVCTDTNCFDDISGMPGSEQGGRLLGSDDSADYEAEQGPLALVMCLVFGLLTVYAMSLNRNRQDEQPTRDKSDRRPGSGGAPPSGDDHGRFRRNDDNDRPAI